VSQIFGCVDDVGRAVQGRTRDRDGPHGGHEVLAGKTEAQQTDRGDKTFFRGGPVEPVDEARPRLLELASESAGRQRGTVVADDDAARQRIGAKVFDAQDGGQHFFETKRDIAVAAQQRVPECECVCALVPQAPRGERVADARDADMFGARTLEIEQTCVDRRRLPLALGARRGGVDRAQRFAQFSPNLRGIGGVAVADAARGFGAHELDSVDLLHGKSARKEVAESSWLDVAE
jgi:hypothetical protein